MDIPLTGLEITELFCIAWSPDYKPWQIQNISVPAVLWQDQVGSQEQHAGTTFRPTRSKTAYSCAQQLYVSHLTSFPITFDNGDFTIGSLSHLLSNKIYVYGKMNKHGSSDLQICQTGQRLQLSAHISILS